MSVNPRYLASVGPTHWSYRTNHPAGDLLSPGYWDEAAHPPDQIWGQTLSKGDFIFVSGHDWAMMLYVFQSDTRVVVGVMNAIGLPTDLPAIESPHEALS
jgi:hypothetical protein